MKNIHNPVLNGFAVHRFIFILLPFATVFTTTVSNLTLFEAKTFLCVWTK